MNFKAIRKLPTGAALALGLLWAGAASAQLSTGSLEGTGRPGDSVTVRNLATEHTLQSGVARNGRFHFRRLPIGIYEVVIHRADGSADSPILARARLGEIVQVN
jgi:hypothetical protein